MKRIMYWLTLLLVTAGCETAATTPILPTAPAAPTDSAATPTNAPTSPAADTTLPPTGGVTNAAAFPNPSAYSWAPVATGLYEPTDIEFPDDGSGRMFVVEQPGRIVIVRNGQTVPALFLDISNEVNSAGSEQGLLGLAFHPQFASNPYFYVNYTDASGSNVIARFQANGDKADPASEKDLLRIPKPFPNHNGGVLKFGPDGYLYLGLGDGGSEGDPLGYGQNTGVLLGKLLRIDVTNGNPYSIPRDNPFVNGGGRPEIWAYGLRNPWKISFDRATADLYIADVGQDTWEEIDFLPAGAPGGSNFGWNYREGKHPYSLANPPAGLHLIDPVTEYSHNVGGCAEVGGYVYRGSMPEWQGIYLYGDFCSGLIWGLMHSGSTPANFTWTSKLLFQTKASITTFGQDPSGEIYFADRGGTIYKLERQ